MWALAWAVAGLWVAASPRPAAASAPAVAQDSARVIGFAAEGSARQRDLERVFLAVPSPAGAAVVERLVAEPHMAGTVGQAVVADTLAAWLSALGFQVETERFDLYLPHPDSVAFELVAPWPRAFLMREPDAPGDVHGWQWNAFSADGVARGPVVYVNYGRAQDYVALERVGVDVVGSIVLARYGGVYRGAKVREAERRGAAGMVLYPDPADDGFAAGDTLPEGPYRPTDAVQRGTVSFLWRYPGDPLTPGRPARPGVPRLEPSAAGNLPAIPVLNLTAAQAREVLTELGGPESPPGGQGGWPLTYRMGPGPAEARIEVRQHYRQRPVRNVIARLPGREAQSVIVGVHYDAWVRGGVDAGSGMAAVLEIARGLATLRETGWRPRRELVLAFWDAEEFGAAGSTEFVEARREWLSDHAVAYLNVDVLTAGDLDVTGSPSLRDLVWSAARDVRDPVSGAPLARGWLARWTSDADSSSTRPPLRPPGAGSDWTAFFHFAGVPSLQWTMNGRGVYATYHSTLDDFDYLRTRADSALLHAPRMAAVMGLAALRLAEAEALPFDYVRYAERIGQLVDSVTAGPVPSSRRSAPELDSIRAAVRELRAAAALAAEVRAHGLATGDVALLRRLNLILPRVEAAFLRERPEHSGSEAGEAMDAWSSSWYRHVVFGSDPITGYGATPVPSLQPQAPPPASRERGSAELVAALRRAAVMLREAAEH